MPHLPPSKFFSFLVSLILLGTNLVAQSPIPEGAVPELIADGFSLSEGPYWHPDGYLLFSDVSANTIFKWSKEKGVEVFQTPSGQTNGITADLWGNVLVAQHASRQIGLFSTKLGTIKPLSKAFNGAKFHSPNDLVVKSDGAIFFTDPPWGGNPSEIDFHGVYRIPPSGGSAQLLVDSLDYPNGIAFSPDESKLYVAETNNGNIHVFDVIDDSTLANNQIFAVVSEFGNADQTSADGLKVDNAGNLWATGSEGVAIIAPTGELLDVINVPGSTTNLGWGGSDRLTLFITNFTGLYKIDLGALKRPTAPTKLHTTKTNRGIELQWEVSADGIKSVTIYRKTDGGDFKKIMATSFSQTFTDSEITPTLSYTYKITVTDVMGFESSFSKEITVVGTENKNPRNGSQRN